ncbi:MAG: hypothetical protein ABIE55_03690 [Candidatus Aenigmatarchaeota archaeon]
MNRFFEFAKVLATLAGFSGIICSLMFSSFVSIRGQWLDFIVYTNDLHLEKPQIYEQQKESFDSVSNVFLEDSKFTLNNSAFLLALGVAFCSVSIFFALLGFKHQKDKEDLQMKNTRHL